MKKVTKEHGFKGKYCLLGHLRSLHIGVLARDRHILDFHKKASCQNRPSFTSFGEDACSIFETCT